MKKEYIVNESSKYIYLYVTEEYHNFNFEALFEYIGKNCGNPSYRYEANAYKAIREKSDEFLRAEKPKNIRLKTSKREVKSIRMSFNKKHFLSKNVYVVRVPYKVSYIFKAIISIVNELSDSGYKVHNQTLEMVKNMTYGKAFYSDHIKTYDNWYNEIDIRNGMVRRFGAQLELNNDFHSDGSIFNEHFL